MKTLKRLKIGLSFVLCILYSSTVSAWEYKSEEVTTTHSAQIRVGADFSKKWNNGLRLAFSEDLRSDIVNSATGAAFRTSFTTLSLGYTPVQYLRLDMGYTLKYMNKDTTAVNKHLRHRAFLSVTGSYRWDWVKLSLRERVLMEARTDSINPLEKNRFDWQLRTKLEVVFTVPGKPVKPYLWSELINTLNAPEYQQRYKENNPANKGHQYICNVRAQAGVKWRLTRLSSLDFYYRFTYGYDRDINITRNKGYIELTEETLYQHAIGVSYNLNW